jgi:hypothetical protein
VFYSVQRLKQAAQKVITEGRGRIASQRVKSASPRVKVFLSHSHADKVVDNLVEYAELLLGDQNLNLYVDSDDLELPPETCPETAADIKVRIRQCGKFILLATKRSIKSIWCGWELGVADTLIGINNVVLWPNTEQLSYSPEITNTLACTSASRRLMTERRGSSRPI